MADERLDVPLRTIVAEYTRRTGTPITVRILPADQVNRLVDAKQAECDLVLCMAAKDEMTPVGSLPEAKNVAWKHPTGEPVWGAVIGDHAAAPDVVHFIGGATGHRLWSESPAGFTIVSGASHAAAFQWVADNRVAHTYPMTATRMLRECGMREGICIDIGCGPGNLDVELANAPTGRSSVWISTPTCSRFSNRRCVTPSSRTVSGSWKETRRSSPFRTTMPT